MFVQADFGLVRDAGGELSPRLVKIQGFPSLYAFQPVLVEVYRGAYEMDPRLRYRLSAHPERLVRDAILQRPAPENVVLLKLDPLSQNTLLDFLHTDKLCGIRTINIRDVRK